VTGKYRGPCHGSCNIALNVRGNRWNNKAFIPVVFHNLRGYDGHLILKEFSNRIFEKAPNISCIPNNMERYLSFSIDNLRFIDSLQFLNSSLEKLAETLSLDDFKYSRLYWPNDKLNLLLRKGVYPYDFMDGPEKMLEPFPTQDAFLIN